MGILDRILRAGEGKKLKALQGLVPDINARAPEIEGLSDEALRATAMRVIGQRHFDVQLMGGAALHFGWVAEMKTGEGKTLVSTLPAYLNGLSGRGMHLVTVNDYLASFHADWMGRIHHFLGLTVGLILPGRNTTAVEKRAQ